MRGGYRLWGPAAFAASVLVVACFNRQAEDANGKPLDRCAGDDFQRFCMKDGIPRCDRVPGSNCDCGQCSAVEYCAPDNVCRFACPALKVYYNGDCVDPSTIPDASSPPPDAASSGCAPGAPVPDLFGYVPDAFQDLYTKGAEGAWLGLLTRGESSTLAANRVTIGDVPLEVLGLDKVNLGATTGIVYVRIPPAVPIGASSIRFAVECPAPQAVPFEVINGKASAVYEVLPASGVDGDLISLTGLHLTGADDMALRDPASATTKIPKFDVVDDTKVTFTVPFVSPGKFQVWVHTPAGWSTSLDKPFTRN